MQSSLQDALQALDSFGRQAFVQGISVSTDIDGLARVSLDLLLSGHDDPVASVQDAFLAGPRWISADTPPDSDDDVLVTLDGAVRVANWQDDDGWSIDPAPTHWMPVPQPPEENEHDVPRTRRRRRRVG